MNTHEPKDPNPTNDGTVEPVQINPDDRAVDQNRSQVPTVEMLAEIPDRSESSSPGIESAIEDERFNRQADGLLDALIEEKDLRAPFACLSEAAFEIASGDRANGHGTPIPALVPAAVARANELNKHTAEWYRRSDPDEILVELNRVLNPEGLRVQYSDFDPNDWETYCFQFVPIDSGQ